MVPAMEGLATGREALDRHLAARAPVHEAWVGAPLLRWDEGGPEPLSRVVYLEEDGVWRFVGHGLTELDEKTSDDAELSGWGFEVTMAVRAGELAPSLVARARLAGSRASRSHHARCAGGGGRGSPRHAGGVGCRMPVHGGPAGFRRNTFRTGAFRAGGRDHER